MLEGVEMSFWRVIGWRDRCLGLARRCVLGSVVASGLAWGQTAPPGGRASLDSGATNVFQVSTVPLVVRDETTSGLVRFRVGFATEEAAAAGGLFDAASLRLTRFSGDAGGLVGVFDSVGTLWRPANDGGLEIGSGQLTVKTVSPAGWLDASPFEGLTLRVAYEVEVRLWPMAAPCPFDLQLELFSNLDPRRSLAIVDRVRRGEPFTGVRVLSSSSPVGPFVVDPDVTGSGTRRSKPAEESRRFYRVISDVAMTLDIGLGSAGERRVGYRFETGPVVLLSAPGTNTAFVEVTAQHDATRREFRLPVRADDRLFRIGAAVLAVVVEDRVEGAVRVIGYEFRPRRLRLQSSPYLCGPYADEEELVLDRRRQVFEVARVPGARFFQLEAGEDRVSAPRIGAVERSGDNGWELRWEDR